MHAAPGPTLSKRADHDRPHARASEIELKFAVTSDDLARLRTHPRLARGQRDARIERIESVYFDSPDFALHRAGLSLRLRRIDAHFVQTLKREDAAAGALSRRDEWEIGRDAPVVDTDALFSLLARNANASDALAALRGARDRLAPSFKTQVRRDLFVLRLGRGTLVQVGIDEGEIESMSDAALHLPIREIELELIRGDVDAALRLALRLARDIALVALPHSKADRGYALVEQRRFEPAKMDHHGCSPARDGVVAPLLRQGLRTVLLDIAQPGDVEAIHQARVAVRRMRSALHHLERLERGHPLHTMRRAQRALREMNRVLGEHRDWDVFCTTSLPALADRFRLASGWTRIAAAARRSRAAAHAHTRAFAGSRLLSRCVIDLERLAVEIAAGADVLASHPKRALRLAHACVTQGFGDRPLDLPEGRHRLRVDVKHLRYLVDLVAGKHAAHSPYHAALTELQTVLGDINDAAVAAALLERLSQNPALNDRIARAAEEAARGALAHVATLVAQLSRVPPPWQPHAVSAAD